ncbi:hydrogenase/urease maturation nickel metallochaperone HypA [Microbulbifer harenosus]|uniref:Hydrogenase maturation nickel metallochaperone HypA n=1 Tax=Microbulbifer harenosus TaxID=2576840 RepID=A0ABY2UFP9_9GAMM|nr:MULTISPECIES: hydrogenase/urease maturation nickel metallochaperone HypA [Microbulbifer]QIL89206.1 hydrogenase maturation nickel metallochaperone HypA [Microbulbifer sp. SH-1]TLM76435.1 hydrogenase maturation nickel metallochaperone HypA [Microbulbifer harenosus]
MHEHSLINNLLDKIHRLAVGEGGRLVAVRLRLGALAHISADHLREHFEQATIGTSLHGLRLHIEEQPDIHHPEAQDIVLDSLEFEQPDES